MIFALFAEAIIFALYIFVCLTLMKPRFSLHIRILVYSGSALCPGAAVTALVLLENGTAALTLLPLIAYLPWFPSKYSTGFALDIGSTFVMLALAAGTAFSVFRCIRNSFRTCAANAQNRLLLLTPTATVFLLIFYNLSFNHNSQ